MYLSIEKKIQDHLNQVDGNSLKTTPDWTRSIKQTLAQLGEDQGYLICTSGFPGEYSGEWLYDMVWYGESQNQQHKYMTSIPLVMECEWHMSLHQIKYDFEKLLVANAEHRLMICYAHENFLPDLKLYFKNAVRFYQQGHKGDRFMIAILVYETLEFHYVLEIKA